MNLLKLPGSVHFSFIQGLNKLATIIENLGKPNKNQRSNTKINIQTQITT